MLTKAELRRIMKRYRKNAMFNFNISHLDLWGMTTWIVYFNDGTRALCRNGIVLRETDGSVAC
jgi:hypothetical protein